MSVTIKLKYLRHSARKLRPVTRLMAGKNLDLAIRETSVMPQDSAMFINKALRMAKAAAEQKAMTGDDVMVTQIFASTGPKIKRIRANARGRTNAYKKHLAHLTVVADLAPAKLEKSKKVTKKASIVKKTEGDI